MAKDKDDTPIPSKKKGSKSSGGSSSSSRGPSPQMARLMLGTRLVGVVIGGFVTVVGVMSLVGLVTDNFLARLLVGLVVAVGLPAFIADRLLKRTSMGGGLPMVADVFAIALLLIAIVFVSADPVTHPMFDHEGDLYARSGSIVMARTVYWIGGTQPVFAPPKGQGAASSASASASASVKKP